MHDCCCFLISVGYPDASSQYVHFHYGRYVDAADVVQLTAIYTMYQCFARCLDETSFVCDGFDVNDYSNFCRLRAGNYDNPGAIVGAETRWSDYAFTRTGTHDILSISRFVRNGTREFSVSFAQFHSLSISISRLICQNR